MLNKNHANVHFMKNFPWKRLSNKSYIVWHYMENKFIVNSILSLFNTFYAKIDRRTDTLLFSNLGWRFSSNVKSPVSGHFSRFFISIANFKWISIGTNKFRVSSSCIVYLKWGQMETKIFCTFVLVENCQ
jgi:hypothetical protein